MRNVRLLILALVAGIAVIVLGGIFFAAPRVFSQPDQGPEQPIAFPHVFHVRGVGLDCTFCHRTAATERAAGLPSVQQCMFCHQVAGHQNPEVQKLLKAFNENQPINWVRVHRIPDHNRFLHSPHIQANIPCETCHGDVGSMTVVRQVRPLKMGDCVSCHRERNAPTDCWICHY